ncbi:MAG: sugar ABC transporter permease [Chloroflexi bacterium]|nr:sugar ABC transporter permease [Chloroflexota bacterium]
MDLAKVDRKIAVSRKASTWRQREQWWAWAFAAPGIIMGTIFIIVPFLMAFVMSFTSQRLLANPNLPTRFIGLTNYVRLFTDDPLFWRSLQNNAYFVVVVVPLQTSFALLLALLVNQKVRFVNVFRAAYYTPVVLPMVVVSTIWIFLYTYNRGDTNQGLINSIVLFLSGGRLGPYYWLGDTRFAMPAIMLLSIWQGVGFQMIIFLAGLQEIPTEMYEASAIDGANKWQQFFFVTLPLLRNTTIFVVVTTTIFAFGLYDQVNIMTGGGPLDSTATMVFTIVNYGFKQMQIGYASALSVVYFVIVLVLSMLQRRIVREEKAVLE